MLKNLVFDFGNVLVEFKPEKHLREITGSDAAASELRDLIWESAPWKAGDYGRLSREESIAELTAMYPEKAELLGGIMRRCSAWLTMPEDNARLLGELRAAGFRLFYISNTNPDDFAFMTSAHSAIRDMDGGVASFQEGVLKPDPAIYRLLLERYGLEAGECLFVDDMPVNTEAAAVVGFRTLTLTGGAGTLRRALAGIPEIMEKLKNAY